MTQKHQRTPLPMPWRTASRHALAGSRPHAVTSKAAGGRAVRLENRADGTVRRGAGERDAESERGDQRRRNPIEYRACAGGRSHFRARGGVQMPDLAACWRERVAGARGRRIQDGANQGLMRQERAAQPRNHRPGLRQRTATRSMDVVRRSAATSDLSLSSDSPTIASAAFLRSRSAPSALRSKRPGCTRLRDADGIA